MQTETNSILKQSALGCVLALTLLHGAGSLCAQTRVGVDKTISASSGGTPVTATSTQQGSMTGTWNWSIRYTGRDDANAERGEVTSPRKISGAVKGKDVPPRIAATNNSGEWITARLIAFRVKDPRPGNLTFMLNQDGEKVAGMHSGPDGPQRISGTVKRKDVSFSFAVTNDAGEQITARFAGEVLSSNKIEGTVSLDLKSFLNGIEKGPKRISRVRNAQGPF